MAVSPQDSEVLIADADPAEATRLRHALRHVGLTHTHVAHDGYAALVTLKRTRIGVLVVAADLAHVDGFELLTYLRKIPGFPFPKAILVADPMAQDGVNRATELGVLQFLVRPFDDRTLAECVRKLTSQIA